MDTLGHTEVYWGKLKIRSVLWERGPMSRRDLQINTGNRRWTANDFRVALLGLIHEGIVKQEGSIVTTLEAVKPPDFVEARRDARNAAALKEMRESVTIDYVDVQRSAVWDKTQGQCWYCGATMNPFRDFRIDHVDPSVNDSDNLANMVPACLSCDVMKHGKTLEAFRSMYPVGYHFYFEQIQKNT